MTFEEFLNALGIPYAPEYIDVLCACGKQGTVINDEVVHCDDCNDVYWLTDTP